MTRIRLAYAAGAVLAAAVTVVFAVVGDGVEASDRTGIARWVEDHAHTAVWALLTVALGTAAVRGAWAAVSQWAAVGAGALYVAFLATVLL